MNRIVKISLISVGGVVATGLVSAISYVKGKKDGIALTEAAYKNQLSGEPHKNTRAAQPSA